MNLYQGLGCRALGSSSFSFEAHGFNIESGFETWGFKRFEVLVFETTSDRHFDAYIAVFQTLNPSRNRYRNPHRTLLEALKQPYRNRGELLATLIEPLYGDLVENLARTVWNPDRTHAEALLGDSWVVINGFYRIYRD